jgi:hypothetical protein
MGKTGRILFDRPKPTAGCSVSGRRREESNVKAWTAYGTEFMQFAVSLRILA